MPISPSAELVDGIGATWFPVDHGYISWTLDPAAAASTFTLPTAGTSVVAALKVNGGLISNISYRITTGGGTLTSAQCFVGLYQNGALLGSSADQSTAWAGTGLLKTALATPAMTVMGIVYVAFVFNGTTGPTLAASNATTVNDGLAAAASRYATANTGVTTALPASLGTLTATPHAPFVALS